MKDVVSKNALLESNSEILESIYDNVIEMNCEEQTLRYVKLNDASSKPWIPKSVRVVLWDAVNYWIDNMVYENDRPKLHSTLKKVCNNQMITCNLKFRLIKEKIKTGYCRGKIIRTPLCCWLCFNSPESENDGDLAGEEKKTITKEQTQEIVSTDMKVKVHTFGYFDVFVNGSAVLFRSQKAKELLALLVDRKGGYVTASDAITCLWENEPVNEKTLSRYRKVALRLNNTLKEYGIENIIQNVHGNRKINPELVECDLYKYLEDKEKNSTLFSGNYMINYSWSEVTLASL